MFGNRSIRILQVASASVLLASVLWVGITHWQDVMMGLLSALIWLYSGIGV